MKAQRAIDADLLTNVAWCTPEALGKLTPAQIELYLLHPRDRDTGMAKREDPAAVAECAHLTAFLNVAGLSGASQGEIDAKAAEILAAHEARRQGKAVDPEAARLARQEATRKALAEGRLQQTPRHMRPRRESE